ncbi:hypothetical protein Cch01nite_04180 [Cellulomonas chitinilytica]|uniref:Uncharacterized protein n=1 Tax=Cellulomonas chitinilytica TaxID=398759 RepID=A0A919P236_9CELL|nr:hypothetical protein [Cellulomonas chitinilytica]GIG19694.1 hypothetical protein Cch01nite_04180 [Cellulomonas chitinilytica]
MISSHLPGSRPSTVGARGRVLVTLVLVGTLAACTGGTGDDRARDDAPDAAATAAAISAGVVLDAELNQQTGAITFPLDPFLPTKADSSVLDEAILLDAAACADAQGVRYLVPARDVPQEYDQDALDGPWTIAQAERFAFVQPMTDADLRGNGIVGAPSAPPVAPRADRTLGDIPTDSPERQVVDECYAKNKKVAAELRAAQSPTAPWMRELSDAATAAQESDVADGLRAELRACYEQQGIAVDPAAFDDGHLGFTAGVAGADPGTIDADQIALAVGVVRCKDQVRYTERAAALVAQAQAPLIIRNLDEMRAFRQNLDDALAQAQDIVAAHADLTTTW